MKILVYTDNHFCTYSSILRERGQKYSKRLENQIESLNWVEKVAKDFNCSKIICLGDFFDSPDLKAEELTALSEINWNSEIEHVFLVGNHELGSQENLYSSTKALSKYGQVIDKPTIDCGYGYELFYLPYIIDSNRKPLAEYIKETQNEYYAGMVTTQEVKKRIILSHNDIAGIQYGQFISKSGFHIEEICNHCSLFVNGHLHNQAQINNKILNLGNLTGQNFSEDGFKHSHCIGILDTDTLKIDLINNPYAFNFYKLDFTENNWEQILKNCNNAIVTVRVFDKDIHSIREMIAQNSNIICFRLLSVPFNVGSYSQIQSLSPAVDHVTKFKEYVLDSIEKSDILIDELKNL